MEYIIAGLGNPGEEYENTRHNVGRMVAEKIRYSINASDWRDDKKLRARMSQGIVGEEKVTLVLPDNYMNRSGGSLAPLVTTKKQAEHLIVIHDDIDLPLGTIRIVFDRGAGGHNGVLSIERTLKTRAFVRVRVGVVPVTADGKQKKPQGEDKVYDFILQQLRKKEREAVDVVVERAMYAVLAVVNNGRESAMQEFNRSE